MLGDFNFDQPQHSLQNNDYLSKIGLIQMEYDTQLNPTCMVPDNKGCDQFLKLRVHSGDYVPIVTAHVGIYGLK